MYNEKKIADALKDIKHDIKAIEEILDDPKFGLAEIKKEIKDIEKKLDKDKDKDHDKKHGKDHDKNYGKDDKKHGFKDWKKNFYCLGNVTILMTNNLVFTGRLIDDGDKDDGDKKRGDDIEFLTLTLTAPLLAQPGGGDPALIQPYYVPGDTVKLGVNQIETIGPSHALNSGG